MTISSNITNIVSFPDILTNLLDNLSSQDKRTLRATCHLFQQMIPAPVSRPVYTFRLLAELDLSNNIIDYDNSEQAIGNSLSALTALTSLDLSDFIIDPNNGTQPIGNYLSARITLIPVDLSKP